MAFSSNTTTLVLLTVLISIAGLSMPSAEAGLLGSTLVSGIISCPVSLATNLVNCAGVTSIITDATVELVSVSGSIVTTVTSAVAKTDSLGSFSIPGSLIQNILNILTGELDTTVYKLRVTVPSTSACFGIIPNNVFFLPLSAVSGVTSLIGGLLYLPGLPFQL